MPLRGVAVAGNRSSPSTSVDFVNAQKALSGEGQGFEGNAGETGYWSSSRVTRTVTSSKPPDTTTWPVVTEEPLFWPPLKLA